MMMMPRSRGGGWCYDGDREREVMKVDEETNGGFVVVESGDEGLEFVTKLLWLLKVMRGREKRKMRV